MIEVVVIAVVAFAVVAVVAWPVIHGVDVPPPDVAVDPAWVVLEDEIATSLRAIREIRDDHAAGNLSDDDFATLERAERANAARLLRRRRDFERDALQ